MYVDSSDYFNHLVFLLLKEPPKFKDTKRSIEIKLLKHYYLKNSEGGGSLSLKSLLLTMEDPFG